MVCRSPPSAFLSISDTALGEENETPLTVPFTCVDEGGPRQSQAAEKATRPMSTGRRAFTPPTLHRNHRAPGPLGLAVEVALQLAALALAELDELAERFFLRVPADVDDAALELRAQHSLFAA